MFKRDHYRVLRGPTRHGITTYLRKQENFFRHCNKMAKKYEADKVVVRNTIQGFLFESPDKIPRNFTKKQLTSKGITFYAPDRRKTDSQKVVEELQKSRVITIRELSDYIGYYGLWTPGGVVYHAGVVRAPMTRYKPCSNYKLYISIPRVDPEEIEGNQLAMEANDWRPPEEDCELVSAAEYAAAEDLFIELRRSLGNVIVGV